MELKKYKKQFRHCEVPRVKDNNQKYSSLGRWCSTQRRLYKQDMLLPDREEKLNALGFAWDVFEKLFEDRFAELKQFRQKYGHCDVRIPDNRQLARWCRNIRVMRKENNKNLTKERITSLTKFGFLWTEPRKGVWEQKFLQLKAYKEKYGNCNISKYTAPANLKSLAGWVYKQRALHKRKSKILTIQKIRKLNSLEFCWEIPYEINTISTQNLLKELKRLYKLRERLPSAEYIEKYGKYPSWLYFNHFGGIIQARKAAGLGAARVFKTNTYTDAELLNDLKRLQLELGKTPSHGDVRKHGKYADLTYDIRFGGIVNARKKAGLNSKISRPKKHSDTELLEELKRLKVKLGRIPYYNEVDKYGKFSASVYDRRFGGIVKARKMAGLGA